MKTMAGKNLEQAWMEYWHYNVSLDSTERISKIVFFNAFRYGEAFGHAAGKAEGDENNKINLQIKIKMNEKISELETEIKEHGAEWEAICNENHRADQLQSRLTKASAMIEVMEKALKEYVGPIPYQIAFIKIREKWAQEALAKLKEYKANE